MSAQPVNVLAILDSAARYMGWHYFLNAEASIQAARAAVAGLLEAWDALDASYKATDPDGLFTSLEVMRMRDARARCGAKS